MRKVDKLYPDLYPSRRKIITVPTGKTAVVFNDDQAAIIVLKEMKEFLIKLSKELNKQDNRHTASPYFFQVQSQEQVVAAEGCGTEAWHYDGSMIETEKEIIDTLYDHFDGEKSVRAIKKMDEYEREEALEEAGWQKCNYEYKDLYQNAFLTAKACKEHIKYNLHHYYKPVDYLSYADRNPELEMVLKFLSSLTPVLNSKK